MSFSLDLKGTGMAWINFSFSLISLDLKIQLLIPLTKSIQRTLRSKLRINEKWKKHIVLSFKHTYLKNEEAYEVLLTQASTYPLNLIGQRVSMYTNTAKGRI